MTTGFKLYHSSKYISTVAPFAGAELSVSCVSLFTVKADSYLANDIAVSDHSIFTLPIHQKTDNFTLRLFNDSPFPVSLNSMMWEGLYAPRFYRRT